MTRRHFILIVHLCLRTSGPEISSRLAGYGHRCCTAPGIEKRSSKFCLETLGEYIELANRRPWFVKLIVYIVNEI